MKIKNSWIMFFVFASLIISILGYIEITLIIMHIVLLLKLLQEEVEKNYN